jgi:hypothetical protein
LPGQILYFLMDGSHKAPVLKGVCIFLLAGIILAAGCLDESGTENGQTHIPVPTGFTQYTDTAKGYTLAAPSGWNVQIADDNYLLIREEGTPSSVMIWPIYLGGQNAHASAVGLTSYTAGLIARQHPDFNVVSVKKSADNAIVEIIGNYSVRGTPMTVVMTSMVKEGSGLFIAYEAPSAEFAAKEDVMREIISTFALTTPQSRPQPTTEILLQEVRPQVYFNPSLPQFPGGMTLKIPSGWVAYQQQADTCSINWWAAENQDYMTQTAVLSQFMIFKSDDLKKGQVDYWQLYGASGQQWVTIFQNMPVNGNVAPDTFLTSVLPGIGQSAYLQQYYPNLNGITNVRIGATHPLDDQTKSFFSTALNANAGSYDFTFTKSGVAMKGSAIIWAADFPGTPWWNAGMFCILAPESEYAAKEQVLVRVFESQSVTPEWQQACRAVSKYQADVQNQVFEKRQESQDRIAEKWDDVILDRDRLYNPDTGEVYHVDISFPDYYKTNRENFEMQNLRELNPDEWQQIPLDGQFYIR